MNGKPLALEMEHLSIEPCWGTWKRTHLPGTLRERRVIRGQVEENS